MHLKHRKTCRVCGSDNLKPVMNFGDQYLQGSFIKDGWPMPPSRKIAVSVVRCDPENHEQGCGLVQLSASVPPPILYTNYWYKSGTTQTMTNHLRSITEDIAACLDITHKKGKKRAVLDIACNDGTLLKQYPDSYKRVGVDLSDEILNVPKSIEAHRMPLPNPVMWSKKWAGRFDAISVIAMFYDLEDPVTAAKCIKHMLAPQGVVAIEVAYLPFILKQLAFDGFCHEHIEYYSYAVLERIFKEAGLRIFRVKLNEINGGSILCYMTHDDNFAYDKDEYKEELYRVQRVEFDLALDTDKPYKAFAKNVEACRKAFQDFLKTVKTKKEKIHVYGASTKGNVLLQYYGLSHKDTPYAAERNPKKYGAKTVGTNIEIISEEDSRKMKPDYYLVLPWHFQAEIVEREKANIEKGIKLIFPLPKFEVVSAANIKDYLKGRAELRAAMDCSLEALETWVEGK